MHASCSKNLDFKGGVERTWVITNHAKTMEFQSEHIHQLYRTILEIFIISLMMTGEVKFAIIYSSLFTI